MSSYNIGINTTKVETKQSYGEGIVEATFNEDMYFNKYGKEIRKSEFADTFNADSVSENDSITSRRILYSAAIVTGEEFRPGEIFSIFDSSSNYKQSAKVVSCKAGEVIVDLFGNEDVVNGDTFSCNQDRLFKAGKVIRFDSRKYGNPTFASDAGVPSSSNLTITKVENTELNV